MMKNTGVTYKQKENFFANFRKRYGRANSIRFKRTIAPKSRIRSKTREAEQKKLQQIQGLQISQPILTTRSVVGTCEIVPPFSNNSNLPQRSLLLPPVSEITTSLPGITSIALNDDEMNCSFSKNVNNSLLNNNLTEIQTRVYNDWLLLHAECPSSHEEETQQFQEDNTLNSKQVKKYDYKARQTTKCLKEKEFPEIHGKQKRSSPKLLSQEQHKILKQWFYNHFDHPYPNKMEKISLLDQTGLRQIQLDNFFANLRKRNSDYFIYNAKKKDQVKAHALETIHSKVDFPINGIPKQIWVRHVDSPKLRISVNELLN